MACRSQRDDLLTPSGEERVAPNEQCAGAPLTQRSEGGVDIGRGARLHDEEFASPACAPPSRARFAFAQLREGSGSP